MSEWRPIESAPRDGVWILLCKKPVTRFTLQRPVRIGRWRGNHWKFEANGEYASDDEMAGWMPLPEPIGE